MGEDTITITGSSDSNDTIIINLDDTYGTTTTYISNDSIGYIATDIGAVGSSYTITAGNVDLSTISSVDFNWQFPSDDTHFEIAEVEKMCAEYPALAKVYENFKTMYDLVKQDWQGKKDAENNS